MLPVDLREHLDAQSGAVARRQLLAAGWDDNDIRRLVRRRELVRVHPGVFVNHTGPLTWVNRAWAAVLFYGEAALCDVTALHRAGDPIHVAIEHPRNGAALVGVRLHRVRRLEGRVLWNAAPPRLRVEEAALDVAGRAGSLADAVEVVMAVCRRRSTTPGRLLETLAQRGRTPRGVELRAVLTDAQSGVQSVLERAYIRNVERRHGLPAGRRQVREVTAAGVVYRDVLYEDYGIVLELDGLRWHETSAVRSADHDRDLEVAADGRITVRLGWRQAERHPCRTAARLATVLQRRGWPGCARPCGPRCDLSGRYRAPGA